MSKTNSNFYRYDAHEKSSNYKQLVYSKYFHICCFFLSKREYVSYSTFSYPYTRIFKLELDLCAYLPYVPISNITLSTAAIRTRFIVFTHKKKGPNQINPPTKVFAMAG